MGNRCLSRVLNVRLIVINAKAVLQNGLSSQLTNCRHTTLDIIPKNIFFQQSDYRLIKSLSSKVMSPKAIGSFNTLNLT